MPGIGDRLQVKALYQDAAVQAAEELGLPTVLRQGTTSQAAEKLISANDSYQGTTSVVPKDVEDTSGL